jgi:hypothetical protein
VVLGVEGDGLGVTGDGLGEVAAGDGRIALGLRGRQEGDEEINRSVDGNEWWEISE